MPEINVKTSHALVDQDDADLYAFVRMYGVDKVIARAKELSDEAVRLEKKKVGYPMVGGRRG